MDISKESIFHNLLANECDVIETSTHLSSKMPAFIDYLGIGLDRRMTAAIQRYLQTGERPEFVTLNSTVGGYHTFVELVDKNDTPVVNVYITNQDDHRECYGMLNFTAEKIFLWLTEHKHSYPLMKKLVSFIYDHLYK